ncbi:MAG: type VI secretion system tip protein VgrG, partial [Bacteroidia bacterium]
IVEPSTVLHEEMVQYFCTDWDFALSRAEANGMLAFVDNGKVNIKKPNLNGVPKISVVYGANAYEFEAEMDARDEYSDVEASSWDDSKREVTKKKGTPPVIALEEGKPDAKTLAGVIGLKEFALQHCGQLKDAELEAWASAKLLRSRMAKIRGRAKIDGYMDIKPGDMLGIDKFSKRFNGSAFVSGVVQQISADASFYTEIQFGLPQEWFSRKYTDVNELPASGLLPAVSGLQVGIVKAIVPDPGNDYRVKVNLPMVQTGNDGVWARMATLDAGKERGSFFYPEVGDEVILGFMNDDPREPVILGMLYSKNSNGKPPIEPSKTNNKKGFYTRSKIKLEFDDEKQSVLIKTPDGNQIMIVDKDEAKITISDKSKNSIEMSKDGITINSAKDLNLKAKGDVKIDGVNMTLSASAKFKTEGKSGIEISSSANTVIKGSVVQIN